MSKENTKFVVKRSFWKNGGSYTETLTQEYANRNLAIEEAIERIQEIDGFDFRLEMVRTNLEKTGEDHTGFGKIRVHEITPDND